MTNMDMEVGGAANMNLGLTSGPIPNMDLGVTDVITHHSKKVIREKQIADAQAVPNPTQAILLPGTNTDS